MVQIKLVEPTVTPDNYKSGLLHALNWYNREKDVKDAREYLREYITLNYTKDELKIFDRISISKIIPTYGWITRLIINNTLILSSEDQAKLTKYILSILDTSKNEIYDEVEEVEKVKIPRPTIRDNVREKAREYLGELEGAIDDFLLLGKELNLFTDLKSRTIPQPYCSFIYEWVKKAIADYAMAYESTDEQIKEGYSNIGKRKITQLLKLLNSWLEDLDRYTQFKKAIRKPRVKKARPVGIQVSKLKYKKEDTDLNIKSVSPYELIGANQVWVYNTKYKRLAVYRTESTSGMEVKGSTLKNYDPDLSEQKTLRKPNDVIKEVLVAGKVQLRRIIPELSTKDIPVNGRINEECIILRVIK